MSISQNSQIYNIVSESQIATILSHFDSDYIIDAIKDKIANRSIMYSAIDPNTVYSFELNFNQMKELYPGDIQNIMEVRNETYREIIDIICNTHNLRFNEEELDKDIYSCAFYLYDFLISNFSKHLAEFYVNYIVKERHTLYSVILSNERFTDKELIYTKKIFKDQKIAVISSNLDIAINYINGSDISLYDILALTYPPEIFNFMASIIAPYSDFFKEVYVALVANPNTAPMVMTNIRIELQVSQGSDLALPLA